MGRQVNRAIVLCENWQDKMIMLEEVFGKGIEKDIARQKYDFLQEGINRISKGASQDEKLVLDMVRKTVGKLEKQLYPNPLIRILRRLKLVLYDQPVQMAKFKKLKTENLASLNDTIGGLGLNLEKLKLDQKLDFEQAKTSIDLISPWGTNNYEVKVNFEKDASGQYQMLSYTGMLKDWSNPEKNRSYTFDVNLRINAREAANLLQGRAVLKYYPVGENRMASKWMQLDFKNLTPDGKPQLKETPADHDFNLRQEVTKIAKALNKPELTSNNAINGMEEGNQIALKQLNGKTTYLEANPLNKEITILNDRQQPITIGQLKKQKEAALKLVPEQVKSHTKSPKIEKKQQQDQSLHIS
ncbi:hypothetical protein SAMN05421820_11147 [Pedobacter steynii]|uniref:Uncharacterized protein n=1 Tax=Pedobacter steynii TaxID=430522 RepID=A0A1H0G5H1_9SPHI|nr:hypothetical protein [Pedobacter steynii]NQX42327.1 hypothetical protein [Pedobacter steynii]SDO02084.1 hypothetical protein SAMN05421820_11147 [Pedobacter steynii]